ncbi:uncharacterized protein F5147DRAFT_647724 [Suillus discolor]|uniref:Uncharacterized protein n=1 Tax=Suillus discolor TaxID=1912936 RepID=A0A9P7K0N2_9AGAM|nr:uncharacterized protein F5147DRAFT_647724 [Suillus discolor]KAG2119856.1 hypothetical protein F5147DRAFT_647724 [Suillus discolor]
MLMWGAHVKEYVARCALSKCGYIVFIEKMHNLPRLPIKYYPRRSSDEARPHEIVFLDGNDIRLVDVQRSQPRQCEARQVFDKLLQLDSFSQPSLTEAEFRHFLTRCNSCELVMMRRMFEHHECVGNTERGNREVIDLTTEDID